MADMYELINSNEYVETYRRSTLEECTGVLYSREEVYELGEVNGQHLYNFWNSTIVIVNVTTVNNYIKNCLELKQQVHVNNFNDVDVKDFYEAIDSVLNKELYRLKKNGYIVARPPKKYKVAKEPKDLKGLVTLSIRHRCTYFMESHISTVYPNLKIVSYVSRKSQQEIAMLYRKLGFKFDRLMIEDKLQNVVVGIIDREYREYQLDQKEKNRLTRFGVRYAREFVNNRFPIEQN
jgi:hypothetical protein